MTSPPFDFLDPPDTLRKRALRGRGNRRFALMLLLLLLGSLGMLVARSLPSAPKNRSPGSPTSTRIASSSGEALEKTPSPWGRSPGVPSGDSLVHQLPADPLATSVALASADEADTLPNKPWERGVVTIESRSGSERHVHGSGLLLAGSRFVATNLHVLQPCLEAQVRLVDGTPYNVAGYAAVDVERDLALLALRDGPPELPGYAIAVGDLPPRAQVWAVGHPRGQEFAVTTGTVSRVLPGNQLSVEVRRFARQFTSDEVLWIQHTAPVAEGNSGGPLLDAQGRLRGMNAWMEGPSGLAYAVHVRHLHDLLAKADGRVIPLAELASAPAMQAAALRAASAANVEEALTAAGTWEWQPVSRDHYRTLQHLAWNVTAARLDDHFPIDHEPGAAREAWIAAADRVVETLRQQKWTDPALITLVNEFAAGEIARESAGLFLFASVERLVEGEQGRRGLIAQLAGSEQPLFLELPHDLLTIPAPGAQCLVLGVHPTGKDVRYGANPLRPIIAPVILTGLVWELHD